jgi:hypothetical protein
MSFSSILVPFLTINIDWIFYKIWDTYSLADRFHLYLCLWLRTYDGEPPSSHSTIRSWVGCMAHKICHPCFLCFFLFQMLITMMFLAHPFPFSSTKVPSFYSTNASQFASYFKIGTSYLSPSLSFHFLATSTNEYLTHPQTFQKTSNVSPKMKTTKEIFEMCSLTHSISRVEGRVRVLGWGL